MMPEKLATLMTQLYIHCEISIKSLPWSIPLVVYYLSMGRTQQFDQGID